MDARSCCRNGEITYMPTMDTPKWINARRNSVGVRSGKRTTIQIATATAAGRNRTLNIPTVTTSPFLDRELGWSASAGAQRHCSVIGLAAVIGEILPPALAGPERRQH